jgi:Tfp pilus assembly protein PilN
MAAETHEGTHRIVGWADAIVAAVLLSAVTAGVLFVGADLQTRLDAAGLAARQQERANRALRASVEQLDAARQQNLQIRRQVDGELLDRERRAGPRWTPVLSEISRARPGGIWLSRISLQGAKLSVEGHAGGPQHASAYVGRLMASPYLDYVVPAAVATAVDSDAFVLIGRKAGE